MGFLAALGTAAGATAGTAAMTGAAIASTGMSMVGAIMQGQAMAEQKENEARAAAYNAQVADNNAQAARDAANAKEEAQRRHFNALQGQAIAGVAQSGTGFEGSNLDMLKQNAIANELDALTIRYEGENTAKGLMANAELGRMNAAAARSAASDASTAGFFNAGANLMSGISKYQYAKSGLKEA